MSNFAVNTVLSDTEQKKIVEVYTNDIYYYADLFIDTELDGKRDKDTLKDNFKSMIWFIRDNINKPDMNNIDLLDSIFDAYIRLCAKCDIIPTLEAYSWLIGINTNTLYLWRNGVCRNLTPKYSEAAKRWSDVCKGGLVYALTQSKGGDINRIFIAKAIHGLAETAPIPAAHVNTLNLDNTQLAARLGDRLETVEAVAIEDQELSTKSEG